MGAEKHPVHSLEYEMTRDFATEVQRTLLPWQCRRGWWQDAPRLLGALLLAAVIVWLSAAGLILPAMGGGLLCLVTFLGILTFLRAWWKARAATATALLALYGSDRRVRVEFGDEHVRVETEFARGEGAWADLDEVVIFPGYWTIQLFNGGHIVIPASLVSPELEAFLRARADAAGAPVRLG